jgi:hypothetical protein
MNYAPIKQLKEFNGRRYGFDTLEINIMILYTTIYLQWEVMFFSFVSHQNLPITSSQ